MGLSYREALRLSPQLAALHPDRPGAPREERRYGPPPARDRRATSVNDLGQNKTEALFARWLDALGAAGEVLAHFWEPVNLRLAGRTTLRVDFLVERVDHSIALVDVKGFMEDDAAVKVKVAASVHTWADVYLAYKVQGPARLRLDWRLWDVRPVTRKGIARVTQPDWWKTRRPTTPED